MSSTNFTQHLGLSQFIGTDKPSWLGDVNNDMLKIDNAYGALQTATSSVFPNQLKLISDTVAKNTVDIGKNAADIAVLTTSIASTALQLNLVDNKLDAVDQRETQHFNTLLGNQNANNQIVKDIQDEQVYLRKNMDKIEADVIVATASVSRLQVRLTNAESDIQSIITKQTDSDTDIANLQAETDTLKTENLQQDTAIKNLQSDMLSAQNDIRTVSYRIHPLELLPDKVAKNEQDIANLAADNTSNMGDISSLQADVTLLQTKTSGITDGVSVPFGFGYAAGGGEGFKKSDGTVQPFITDTQEQAQNTRLDALETNVTDLQNKTVNMINGAKIPYSLGIADGGAYGYIKNGEQGVTPFVTSEDVNKIVDLQPIQTQVDTLSDDVDTLTNTVDTAVNNVSTLSDNVDTLTNTVDAAVNNVSTLSDDVDTLTSSMETISNSVNTLTDANNRITGNFFIKNNDPDSMNCTLWLHKGIGEGTDVYDSVVINGNSTSGNIGPSLAGSIYVGESPTKNVGNFGVKNSRGQWYMISLSKGGFTELPFSLGIDSDGNYGYKKVGADTVIPFLSVDMIQPSDVLAPPSNQTPEEFMCIDLMSGDIIMLNSLATTESPIYAYSPGFSFQIGDGDEKIFTVNIGFQKTMFIAQTADNGKRTVLHGIVKRGQTIVAGF